MAINNNWYETSEDMVMPLPLTEEQIGELPESSLTEEMTEDATSRLYPGIHWPPTTNVIVIPLIPGITMFGYIRFFNASPAANDVDIYVNGRRVASNLSYQNFTEYMKVFPGYYRVAVFAAGTRTNPLTVTNINIALREYISGNVLLEDPSIQVEGGKAYTIYIVGDMYTDRRGLQVVIPLEGTTYLQF